jgi:hypothetical protein
VIVAHYPLPFVQPSLSVQQGLEGRPLLTLPAAAHRHPLPLLTTHHPLPTVFLSVLYFHILTNPLAGNPFIFTSIQNPRECTLCGPQCSDLRTLCVALFLQLLCPQTIAASLSLFALFSASLSFVFNQLQPLFQNTPGYGYPGRFCGTPRGYGEGRRSTALLTARYPLSSAYPTACMETTSSGISMRILDNSVRGSSSGGSFSWGTYSGPNKKS